MNLVLVWGKLVLKKETMHNPTRLVYHGLKKYINCMYNDNFNTSLLFGLRLVFQEKKVQKREVFQCSCMFLLILKLTFFLRSRKSNPQQIRARHYKLMFLLPALVLKSEK